MDPNVLLKKDMKEKQELVNIILDRYLPRKDEYPKEIHKALRYSTFAGEAFASVSNSFGVSDV